MMDREFEIKKINLYFSKLKKGDAVWIDGWKEIMKGSLKPGVYVDISKAFDNGARLTTLEHYNPQGGEKVICLGASFKFTFGKTYTVHKTAKFSKPHILNDAGNITFFDSNNFKTLHCWGIIPRYDQVKNNEKEDDGMSEIKVVEESEYTGKFKVGDEVKVVAVTDTEREWSEYLDDVGKIGKVNKINRDSNFYNYSVQFNTGEEQFFTETTLELVKDSNEIKHNDDSLKPYRNNFKVIADEILSEDERPASSHYHIDNNGNDVWQFADDNLSDERVKGFHQVNAIKYVARYEKKHDTAEKRIEDLEKAKVSIDKLIELEGKSMTSKGCDVVGE